MDFENLESALRFHGVRRSELFDSADEVVLFGSRSAGVGTEKSDWDLLLVGNGKARRAPGLDMVWIRAERVLYSSWRTSELATHVAAFGTWLKGSGTWRTTVPSPSAARLKEQVILGHLVGARAAWNALAVDRRRGLALRIRRNIQRLSMLRSACPVPPRQLLDEKWSSRPERDLVRGFLTEVPDLPSELEGLMLAGT